MSVDPTFGLNAFNKTKILTEKESLVNNFLCILFGKPGFYPSIPDLGYDITRFFGEFEDEINPNQIKVEIANMCSDLIPEVNNTDFDVILDHYDNQPLLVFILPTIDDGKELRLALGVTTNANGEFLYKFVENTHQSI